MQLVPRANQGAVLQGRQQEGAGRRGRRERRESGEQERKAAEVAAEVAAEAGEESEDLSNAESGGGVPTLERRRQQRPSTLTRQVALRYRLSMFVLPCPDHAIRRAGAGSAST